MFLYPKESVDNAFQIESYHESIIELYKNTKGFFKNDTYNFYFITYNDIHDFYSGYTNLTIDNNNYYITNIIKNNFI